MILNTLHYSIYKNTIIFLFLISMLINWGCRSKKDAVSESHLTKSETVEPPQAFTMIDESAKNFILYQNCGNDIIFKIPELEDSTGLRGKAVHAEIFQNKNDYTKFRVVPNSRQALVTLYSPINGENVVLGKKEYRVIQPPRPIIEIRVNGKPYNSFIPISGNSKIAIQLTPDSDFKAAFPNDARYNIGSIDILAKLSIGPPTIVKTIQTNGKDATRPIQIDLSPELADAKRGILVFVRLNNISRKNFMNKLFMEKRFSERERSIMFEIK